MNLLTVHHLGKSYRRSERPAVKSVSLELEEGKLLALVGESGSGKTTLLRLLAGLEIPDEGTIALDGKEISAPGKVVEPEKRGIGLVFQNHALFPHLTVGQNIVFGLRRRTAAEKKQTLDSLLELTRLTGMAGRYPHELSGGERQRVALARALAPNPRLLLLDEPFSSLDARLRQGVRDETREILLARRATAIFVTHDTGDALAIADSITVIRHGIVQQSGAPQEVYHAPANAYVASFFGTCNFLPFHSLANPGGAPMACHIGPPDKDGASGLWVRPEDLELVPVNTGTTGDLCGRVGKVIFAGAHQDVHLDCEVDGHPAFEVVVRHHGPDWVQPGQMWNIVPRARVGGAGE
jgi:iron(III) transport system ATP-binding protein